jgi:uncharacterized membrane protein
MDALLKIDYMFLITGLILLFTAGITFCDKANPKRYATATFWGIYGLIFLIGDRLPPLYVGILVVMLALIAGLNWVGKGVYGEKTEAIRQQTANVLGNKLFIPALAIPLITVFCAVLLKDVTFGEMRLFQAKNETLLSLGVAAFLALGLALWVTREKPMQAAHESRRLLEAMGWAVILPQMLATLGILFTDAGVGKAVAHLTTEYLAVDNKLIAVAAYCIGMAVFTMIMGNAFAAFPVITAGIGIPILLMQHQGNPAVMAAIGMFSGYCGTLMTPMAANFNIVPAALLELKDKNGVIKAQLGTALPLLFVNIALMYFLMF